jgi:hypothetical protein
MSAMEQLPLPSTPGERRNGDRRRLDRVLNVLVGRNDGIFVDASLRGAKIRHSGAVRRGATVRIAFDWERQRFSATAEVLASRVIALGMREGESTTFESRFRFTVMSPESSQLLARVLGELSNHELRTWVGNLKGFDETPPPPPAAPTHAAGYLRCRHVHRAWEKKWTRDATQPPDGFVVPAGTPQAEVDALCSTWETSDEDGRRLLQLTAAAVVEGPGE